MVKEYSRTVRVGEQLRRELALLIREEMKDPRVGLVTITDVRVSPDLSSAKVYFSVLGDAEAVAGSGEGLRRAARFLRRQLGQRLRLRTVPELRFIYDETQERGARLSALIDEAVAEDRARSGSDPEEHD